MKVLFLTNGLGLGNSTRCHAIIQRLYARGACIEVVTSGNGLWYFEDKPEVSVVHEIQSLAYGSKDGEISIARTFASVAGMASTLRENARLISSLLDDIAPDVVVSDSDYNFLPVKRRHIPLAALNNSDVVWHSYFKFPDRPSSIRAQFFGVEMLDFGFHRLIPDLVLSPTLDRNVRQPGGNIKRIGPIVRAGYDPSHVHSPAQRAAVMLSGSVFGTPVNFSDTSYPVKIDVIGRTEPEDWVQNPEVRFHGKIKDTYPLLEKADLVVVNGGFSAVSEMFWMRKPLIVVPVPRHAEQWINARTVKHLNVGEIATQSNYESVMLNALDQLDVFKAAYDRLPPITDGAEEAATAIIELAENKNG